MKLYTFRLRIAVSVLPALVVIFSAVRPASCQAFVNTLLPQPKHLEASTGPVLHLDKALPIVVAPELQEAGGRLARQLSRVTGIAFAAPAKSAIEVTPGTKVGQGPAILLHVADLSKVLPQPDMDESYRLECGAGGVRIDAQTRFGLQRGIATLLQMVQSDRGGYFLPTLHIEDAPRFAWRGLLLDPGRHFLPVDVVERTLDAMAAVKLNVLHWHLTENQGFRIESNRYPKLAGMGSNGEFYTDTQVRTVVAYAAERGIRVVPEFDVPGHSTSWFVGYPQLGSGPAPTGTNTTFGVHDEAMDPTRESTYIFLDRFFGEMATLFPDPYVHIGGDESNGRQWEANPAIVSFMQAHGMADTHALQAYFIGRVRVILAQHGKKMVGWDEILQPGLSSDTVIENWHGAALFRQAATQGIAGIYAQPYYLDHGMSAGEMYAADPGVDAGVTGASEHLLLGGEASMWGEQVTAENVESRIWPRTAAIAERLWSPADVMDLNDLYRRLAVQALRLDGAGSQLFSGPQRLIRQLAGSEHSYALETLASAVQPYSFHNRAHAQVATVDTPLDGFVDAAVFDPPLEHDLPLLMANYLHAEGDEHRHARAVLGDLFASWEADGMKVSQSTEPRLQLVALRARELATLGQLGLAALQATDTGSKLTAAQSEQAAAVMKSAAGPDPSLVNFVVLPPMAELFAQGH
jgi:hexosaminidase